MKKFGAKHLVSAVVATATVVSVGCIAMADEIDTTVDEAAEAVAVVEETAETEEVQVQEEAAVVDTDEAVADETEAVVDDTAEVAEVADVAEAAEVVEVVEDEAVYEVEEEIVSEEADYAVTNGWWQDSYGDYYYYKNGKAVTGWQYIDGKYYYFYSDGEMCIGKRYDSEYKALFVFGIKGDMQTGWIKWDNYWYYCDPKTGKAATSWTKIDGNYYYFYPNDTSNPYMYSNGFYNISGETYLFVDGVMQTGWYKNEGDPYYYYYGGGNSDTWYYFGSDGKAAKGWKKINNQWYYFYNSTSNPYMYSSTVVSIYDEDAGKSFYYAFDKNGVMQKSCWFNKYEGADYQVYQNGELIYEGSEQEWYYLGSDGKAVTGWKKIANKYYYFGNGNQTPYARTGVIQDPDSGRYFYCDRDTFEMKTNCWAHNGYTYSTPNGPVEVEGDWFYFGSDGAAVRGWKQISNNWYYFGPGDDTYEPYMRKGVCYISGVYYLFGDSGVMRKGGWYKYYDSYYYADNNGALANGWKTIGGKTYYFYSSGVMATGYSYVGGKLRYFGSDGVCRNPV